MTKIYQYCVAENWGKGFITHTNSIKMSPIGFPANIWRIAANSQYSNKWVTAVNGVHKTLAEAQTIVDAGIVLLQTKWDNDNVTSETSDEKNLRIGSRPTDITLEE